ncbi:MAG: glycosyltransferase, partial [Candidatus Thorarchaeota archaeon]
ILQNADALVLPSYWEGMPTVVLEAMAAGVPVISTRVGDIPLLIEDGKDGILIKRSQNSFRSAIQLLLGDQSLARRIASSARQLVKDQFSLTMMGRTASRLYRDLLM